MSDQYVWRLALTSKTPQSTKPDGNQIAPTGANWIANTWTSNTRNDFHIQHIRIQTGYIRIHIHN